MKTQQPRWRRAIAFSVPVTVIGLALGSLQMVPAEASVTAGAKTAPVPAGCPWMNQNESATKRANQLLAASTLGQKLRWLNEQAANTPAQTVFGPGFFGPGATYPAQVACTPTVVYTDGPDYVRGTTGATVYPSQIALAASFSTDLAYAKGQSQADEAFRAGKNVILGPGVNSLRTPLSGRTPEYLGEDSLLSGDLAAADINGIQKGNSAEPVMAVLKHYIANEQELDRQTSSSNIDGRTLREVYNLPFQVAISKSSPGGVMCAYNQVNGVYSCENPILKNVVKGADGFDGYVVSDFGAVHSTAASLNTGLDQELNAPAFYTPANINAAIDAGSITEEQVNQAAFLVVRAYIKAGLFDHPLPTTPATTVSTASNKAVSEEIAEKGSVLLKNSNSILPLSKASTSIAIIGATASNTPTAGISAATVCAEAGQFSSGAACTNPVAPLDAITARAATVGATVNFSNGSDLTAAAAAAAAAKVAVVFAYAQQGEGNDRTTLALDNANLRSGRGKSQHRSGARNRLCDDNALASKCQGRHRSVVPGRPAGYGNCETALWRRQLHGPPAYDVPEVACRCPHRRIGSPVPRSAFERHNRSGCRRQVDSTGHLQRGSGNWLQVVREQRNRTTVPIRIRPVVHHLCVQQAANRTRRRKRHPPDQGDLHRHKYRKSRRDRYRSGVRHSA